MGSNTSSLGKDLERAQLAANGEETEQILKDLFAKADKNNSGYLEKDEAHAFFAQVYNYLSKKRYINMGAEKKVVIDKWMSHYDKNGDGRLEYPEFKRALDLMAGLRGKVAEEKPKAKQSDKPKGAEEVKKVSSSSSSTSSSEKPKAKQSEKPKGGEEGKKEESSSEMSSSEKPKKKAKKTEIDTEESGEDSKHSEES
eukprot:TRINITY_DN132_c0_g1_i1.p1 TRINITY_DN132_c0_g1~~TRINITY_DN132_c0_g1_i1.p1  ORF type:complete len:198 (-),score=47.95 TRINITY_DN132_c0_g1_i1:15-608(-)